jgi:holo-[acyl-carrier protein] synthase
VIFGIGTDHVLISRIRRIIEGRGAGCFVRRVFSPHEIEVCRSAPKPAECYAVRFAAKEAAVKAMGTGFSHGIGPSCVRIIGGEHGAPRLDFTGAALEFIRRHGIGVGHVSLTHTGDLASAVVVLEIVPGE